MCSVLFTIYKWLFSIFTLEMKENRKYYDFDNLVDECYTRGAFVKMINFAHVFLAEDASIDTNYLFNKSIEYVRILSSQMWLMNKGEKERETEIPIVLFSLLITIAMCLQVQTGKVWNNQITFHHYRCLSSYKNEYQIETKPSISNFMGKRAKNSKWIYKNSLKKYKNVS